MKGLRKSYSRCAEQRGAVLVLVTLLLITLLQGELSWRQLVESLREEHVTPAGKVQRFQFSRLVRR